MSHQLKQSEILAQAKLWAGRKGQNVDATAAREGFDTILRDISQEFNCLPATATGNLTLAQNYITLPEDYWDDRLIKLADDEYSNLKIGGIWLELMYPSERIYYYTLTEEGTPTKYAIEQDSLYNRILIHPHLPAGAAVLAYEFLYFKVHPYSWVPWTGLSGKTDISFTASTKTIASAAAEFDVRACVAGRKITVSGSGSNDGTYTIVSATAAAVVVAEAISDEAAGANIDITVESEGNYLHLYGEKWDPTIVQGTAWKIAEIVKERAVADRLLATYETMRDDLGYQATKSPRPLRVVGSYF